MAGSSVFVCQNPGQHIEEVVLERIDIAKKKGKPVRIEFNQIELTIKPDDTLESVVEIYYSELLKT
jgi:hypothetical protein